MEPDDPLHALTNHPDLLGEFLDVLEGAGFERSGDFKWTGPIAPALEDEVETEQMTIIIRAGWPYYPPGVGVDGIHSWHANRDTVCLWQAGDNTRKWVSLAGIHSRIDEWVADKRVGFDQHGLALDPHFYFEADTAGHILIDTNAHLGANPTDGQTGALKWSAVNGDILSLEVGKFTANDPLPHGLRDRSQVRGRWFYRDKLLVPPRSLDELRSTLTDSQAERFDKDLRAIGPLAMMLVLFWQVGGDAAVLPLLLTRDDDNTWQVRTMAPHPKGLGSRLLRAGPQAQYLRNHSVLIVGCGAIGSHAAELLARSGIGHLTLVDGDRLWPVNLIRHAVAVQGFPGVSKVAALQVYLEQFDWTTVDTIAERVDTPDRIRGLVDSASLIVDATADAAFTDMIADIARIADTPLVTVALFRGGSIARVRRQATDDRPIAERHHHGSYADIPPAPHEVEYLGLETGCVAPINNASPIAVARAAAIAAHVCVDWLTSKDSYGEEIIDVIDPSDPPFDKRGIVRLHEIPAPIGVAESAQAEMRRAAREAAPNETGGVLVGTFVDGQPHVTHAVEIAGEHPSPTGFLIPEGAAATAVETVIQTDGRLGYLGEWHSHPIDQGPSATDRATMNSLSLLDDTGNPVLIVVRPTNFDTYDLDAYRTRCRQLEPTEVLTIGDLAEEDPS